MPILQPEQEKRQRKMLLTHVDENTYKDEILDIFTYIVEREWIANPSARTGKETA